MRIMRVLRILRMVRHFVGLQSLFYTIHKAYREIGLILVIFLVTVIMFSALVFAFEAESGVGGVWTFYDCIWWSLLTLTTVGYHHQPLSALGKLTGGLCALTGVFILTLPVPLVVTSFAVCYKVTTPHNTPHTTHHTTDWGKLSDVRQNYGEMSWPLGGDC